MEELFRTPEQYFEENGYAFDKDRDELYLESWVPEMKWKDLFEDMTTYAKDYHNFMTLASHNDGETDGMFMITENGPEEIESTSQPDHIKGAEPLFLSEEDATEWVYKQMPILIKASKRSRYTHQNPFISGHAFKAVVIYFGKELFNLTKEFSSLPAPVRSVSETEIMAYFNNHAKDFLHDGSFYRIKVPYFTREDVLIFAKWMRDQLKSE